MGEEIDHFISRVKWVEMGLENTSMGGRLNHPENLFLSCKSCNASKRDKYPEVFMGNDYIAWNRFFRANFRVGLSDTKNYER